MIIISHRANLNGENSAKYGENHPNSIKEAVLAGFNVEIDVWFIDGNYYLGHDQPQYQIEEIFLFNPLFWVHCKNIPAFRNLSQNNIINAFFHDKDDATLTSQKFIWTFPKNLPLTDKSIAVLPEKIKGWDLSNVCGICTDFPYNYK